MQIRNKKQFLSTVATTVVSALLVAGAVMGTTTLSENIVTGGTLQVDGSVTLGDAAADTITINGKVGTITLANSETIDNVTDGIITLTGEVAIAPTRVTGDYAKGVNIDSDTFFTGGAANKSYMVNIEGDRTASYAATGDSNDAGIKIALNNYAANDTNFILRGVNSGINNRSGGTLGVLESGSFGAQGKSGGTVQTIRGLTVTPENYGTVAAEFGGIDVVMKNEGAVAPIEYGIRIRNINNSIADAVGAGLVFSDTGANTGFDYGIDMNGASIVVADIRLSGGGTIGDTTVLVPVRPTDDYAYGVKIDSDVFFTGGAAQKSYMFSVSGDRPLASAATGDSNDAGIKVSLNNYAANDTNFILRGVNSGINNRSGGTLGVLESGSFGAQGKSGGTVQTIRGLTVTPENYGTVAAEFGGIDVVMKNEGAVATLEYGIRVRNIENSIGDALAAGLLFSDAGANTGFDYAIDMNGASIVVADIRLSSGALIQTGTGDPNGNVTGTNGSVYIRTGTGDASTTIYVCENDGTTWVAITE